MHLRWYSRSWDSTLLKPVHRNTWTQDNRIAPTLPQERGNNSKDHPIGVIPIDAIFSPIRKVNHVVTNARVGQITDYDKLTVEVWTDGSVMPEDAVAYAAHAGDHTVYPDCRPAFVEAMRAAAALCDWHRVALMTPFIDKTKVEIVAIGAALGVPFAKTWSCYNGQALHCGVCGTCTERREAFALAGITDPTEYAGG